MPIPEDLYKQMLCCLSEDHHIVFDPILITLCNGHACKTCINNIHSETVQCLYCEKEHKKRDLLSMPSNPVMKTIIEKSYLNDLIDDLDKKFQDKLDSCTGKSFKISICQELNVLNKTALLEETLNGEIECRFDYIENKVDIKLESLISEFAKIGEEVRYELMKIKKKLTK